MKEFDLNSSELEYLIDFFKNQEEGKLIDRVEDFLFNLSFYQYLFLINTVFDDIKHDDYLVHFIFHINITNLTNVKDRDIINYCSSTFGDFNIAMKTIGNELSKYYDNNERLLRLVSLDRKIKEVYYFNYNEIIIKLNSIDSYTEKIYTYNSEIFSDIPKKNSFVDLIEYQFGYNSMEYEQGFFRYTEMMYNNLSSEIYNSNFLLFETNSTDIFNSDSLLLIYPLMFGVNSWKKNISLKIKNIDGYGKQIMILDRVTDNLKQLGLILSEELTDYSENSIVIEPIRNSIIKSTNTNTLEDYFKELEIIKNEIKELNRIKENEYFAKALIELQSKNDENKILKVISDLLRDRRINKYHKPEYINEIDILLKFLFYPNNLQIDFDLTFIQKDKVLDFSKVFLFLQHKGIITSNKGDVNRAMAHVFNKGERTFEDISIKQIERELEKDSGIASYVNRYFN